MKIRIRRLSIAFALFSTLNPQFSTALGQGTAFTYQGRLNAGTSPATGSYDLTFTLFATNTTGVPAAGPVTNNATAVTNGLFTAMIDFGPGLFTGGSNWLEIAVRTNGTGSFTTLNPRQQMTPTPYAIFANTASNLSGTISSANLYGAYTGPVTFNNSGNGFSGSFNGNGANVTNVNAATLGGLGADQFWKTTGNSNTVAGVNFLGTMDNQPVEIRVNGSRVVHIEYTTNTPNIIGGWSNNFAAPGVVMAAIAGGGGPSIVNGGLNTNSVWSSYGTVGGGLGNLAGSLNDDPSLVRGATVSGGANNTAGAHYSTISGGSANTISLSSDFSHIGGGQNNTIHTNSFYAAIVGGYLNNIGSSHATIGGGSYHAIGSNSPSTTISGGYNNIIKDNTYDASIGGGSYQTIGTNSYYSTIAGGRYNSIPDNGTASTIAGGYENTVRYGTYATIGGGYNNLAGNAATLTGNYSSVGGGYANNAEGNYATAPGGYQNWAPGDYSFAAGRQAKAFYQGDFVWADSQAADFYASASDQFAVRASGGVSFVTGGAGMTLDGQPVLAGVVPSASLSGTYSSAVNFNSPANSFTGNGSALTGLNAANISSGILVDARLSGNVVLLNSSPTFAGDITMSGGAAYHHIDLSGGNSLGYLYGSFNKYADGIHLGYNYYADAIGGSHIINSGGGTSRISVGYGSIVLATGDVGVQPNFQNLVVNGVGGTTVTVNGTFNNNSDRNAKQDFTPVSPSQILDRVTQLPVSEWSYKTDAATRHLGPMAQDFYSAFNVGTDDKHIAPIDEGGVALAAIQGLNEKLEVRSQKSEARTQLLEEKLQQKETENAELKRRLEALEQIVLNKKSN